MTTPDVPDQNQGKLKGTLLDANRERNIAELKAIAADTNRDTMTDGVSPADPVDTGQLASEPVPDVEGRNETKGADKPEATEPIPQEVIDVVQNISAEVSKIDGGVDQLLDTYMRAKRRVDEAATMVQGVERRLSEPRDNKGLQEKDAVRLVRRSLEDAVSALDGHTRRIRSLRREVLREEETKQALDASLRSGDEAVRRVVEDTATRITELSRRIESAQAELAVILQNQRTRARRGLEELITLRSPQGRGIERDVGPDQLLGQLSSTEITRTASDQIKGGVKKVIFDSDSLKRP